MTTVLWIGIRFWVIVYKIINEKMNYMSPYLISLGTISSAYLGVTNSAILKNKVLGKCSENNK
jgi:hypothetical protein